MLSPASRSINAKEQRSKDAREEVGSAWRLGAFAFLPPSQEPRMHENELSRVIVDCAIEVHRTLGGPGLLEGVYEEALVWELDQRGLAVARQQPVPIVYKGHTLASPLKIDVMVNGLVIVECKATVQYNAIFEVQLLTYLRL